MAVTMRAMLENVVAFCPRAVKAMVALSVGQGHDLDLGQDLGQEVDLCQGAGPAANQEVDHRAEVGQGQGLVRDHVPTAEPVPTDLEAGHDLGVGQGLEVQHDLGQVGVLQGQGQAALVVQEVKGHQLAQEVGRIEQEDKIYQCTENCLFANQDTLQQINSWKLKIKKLSIFGAVRVDKTFSID